MKRADIHLIAAARPNQSREHITWSRYMGGGCHIRRIVGRIGRALSNPAMCAYRLIGTIEPEWLLSRHVRLSRAQGFHRPYFILSFDCDTERDIEVVESVHDRLAEIGITPVYAVPGELLERGCNVYRRLASRGAEFINHGYTAHASYCHDTREYCSTFFYDQLSHDIIIDDIRRGHSAHHVILGKAPNGFRVPHFGTFQKSENLAFLHSNLRKMGYAYSSSTMPLYGFKNGPVHQVSSTLKEISISGSYDNPLRILDSWSYRYAPGRTCEERDYLIQFEKMVRFYSRPGQAGLLNYYADPSQVNDWPEFFEAMKLAAPMAINSYSRLLEIISQ